MILGIIIDVGGVPTDDRGYIGGRYWFVFWDFGVPTRETNDLETGTHRTPPFSMDSMASVAFSSPQRSPTLALN